MSTAIAGLDVFSDVSGAVREASMSEVVWRYAAGCVGNVLHNMSNMTEAEVSLAIKLAQRGTMPTVEQIKWWFPKPFRALQEYGLPESAEGMTHYWRYLHNKHDKNTSVYCGQVRAIVNGLRVSVRYQANGTDRADDVLNIHRFGVAVGDMVYVHARCICEVV